jgi:predicted metal-dependent hydrolase
VSLDWKSEALVEGLACYRRQQFFLAHEHWEAVWLQLIEPEKSFLQALIQTSAAFHHLQAGNRAGAVSLLRRALGRIQIRPAQFGGIEVAPLCQAIRMWLEALEDGAATSTLPYPPITPLSESQDLLS